MKTLPFKLTSFIEFCENGTDDGPYAVTLKDVSAYIISLLESCWLYNANIMEYIFNDCNQASSLMPTISIKSGSSNININLNIGFCCHWLIDSRRIQCNLSYAKCLYIRLNNAYIHTNTLTVHINICKCDKYHLNNIIQSQSLHFYS